MNKYATCVRALVAGLCISGTALYLLEQLAGRPRKSGRIDADTAPTVRWEEGPPGAIICSGRVEPVRAR